MPYPFKATGPHYAWEPVIEWLESHYPLLSEERTRLPEGDHGMPNSRIYELLGMRAQSYYLWRKQGLDDRRADYIATHLGRYPGEFWDDWDANAELVA